MLAFIQTFSATVLGAAALSSALPFSSSELAPRQALDGCQILTAGPLGFNVTSLETYDGRPPPLVYLKPNEAYDDGPTPIEPTNSPSAETVFFAYNCSDSNPTIYNEGSSSVWEV